MRLRHSSASLLFLVAALFILSFFGHTLVIEVREVNSPKSDPVKQIQLQLLDDTEEIWTRAYMIGATNETMIAIVLFRNNTWPSQPKGVCKVGTSCASSRALLIDSHKRKNSQYHTYRIECYFNSSQQVERALAENNYKVQYQEESVPVFRERTSSSHNVKLTMCIPTLFGSMQLSPPFWFWVNEYIKFYEEVHHLGHIFIYTTSRAHFSLAKNFFAAREKLSFESPSTGVPVFINKASSRSFYYNQQLTQFDCFYRSAALGSDWIMFNDIDEVMEWPHSGFPDWDSVIPSDVTAMSFPSWPFSMANGDFSGEGCPGLKQNGTNRPLYNCDHCSLAYSGRRKYALRGNIFQSHHRPHSTHTFEKVINGLTNQARAQIGLHISGMSGIFRLKHVHLESSLLPLKIHYEAVCGGHRCPNATDFDWIGEGTVGLLLSYFFRAVFDNKPNNFSWDLMKATSYNIFNDKNISCNAWQCHPRCTSQKEVR
mmetsp:Transcript_15245/g.33161  ORF Transcript_15245/g.33161 Transcript_15245/m.33161 type:complete len:484 (+) Transcript_15245:108-1559(+)